MILNGGCATDIGSKRKVNQDSVFYRVYEKKRVYFAVMAVCDGVGGLQLGEYASSLITQQMEQWFEQIISWMDFKKTEGDILYAHLKDAAEEWNLSVWEYCRNHNMKIGSTMSLLMLFGDRYYFVQVGDSRIYILRDGELYQITVDACTSRIKNGRMKSYLDNYMGMREELWFTGGCGKIQNKDMFLVCSDGLYHKLLPEDMIEIVRQKKPDCKKACAGLIHKMIERGETDNISAGIILCKG